MPAFDTLDKKPNVWNIAVLNAVSAAVIAALLLLRPLRPAAVGAVVCLDLALTIIFLMRAFFGQLRYNPYSYNTIIYPGFSLFLLSALLTQISLLVSYLPEIRAGRIPAASALLSMFSAMLSSAKTYMLFSAPFILCFSIALCVSNISLIRHEGRRFVNILGIILSFLLVGGEILLFRADYYATGSVYEVMLHDLWVNLFAAFYLYFECMLIGTIIANFLVVRYEPAKDKDFLIILGCGIRRDGTPTPLLAGRIDRALRFAKAQVKETGKEPVFVASGGQGPNEVRSESAAMRDYLLEKGVPKERILMEDRSNSTYENMLFSRDLIRKADPEGKAKVAYATTNYHVFRSGLMARRVKMRALGMGAKTRWYFWPNAAVREFVGLLTDHRLKQGLLLGGMILLYMGSTLVFYLLP